MPVISVPILSVEDTMQYFDFEIMGLKRKLPFVKVGEHLALASFVVLSDT